MHIQPNAGDRFKKKKKSNATAFAAYYRQLIQVGIFFKAECNWFSVTQHEAVGQIPEEIHIFIMKRIQL